MTEKTSSIDMRCIERRLNIIERQLIGDEIRLDVRNKNNLMIVLLCPFVIGSEVIGLMGDALPCIIVTALIVTMTIPIVVRHKKLDILKDKCDIAYEMDAVENRSTKNGMST